MKQPSTPVADTAFMVSWIRAQHPTLSKDHWGHLWATDVAREIGADYARVTGALNARAVCLRHRFFAETALAFSRQHPAMALVNIGAGFTSYPFLLDAAHYSIEMDLQSVIEFREARVREWMTTGALPHRTMNFCSIDLENATAEKMLRDLFLQRVGTRPTLVIMEGLLYYLTRPAVDRVFTILSEVLSPHSRIATVAWPHALQNTTVFQAVDTYFQTRLQRPPRAYTFLDADFFHTWKDLRCVETVDYLTVERRYAEEQLLTRRAYWMRRCMCWSGCE